MTATWSVICLIEWSGDLYASRVSVSCPPRVSWEALRSLIIIRLWFQLSLSCNVSDNLHKPATATTAAVIPSDMLAAESSKYENLAAAHTILSLPTYLCLVTLTMNVLDPEVLGGDMELGI